ncbi:protein translocase subunit SecF [Paremcibacter congregatus]|uniref:Protein-export membrane protein SecF n=1 Tax=Paremcibacter congregatus TaxID=2043170 RepID=A0A2G4YV50_9PROT|nr:protein translocase subunit SecF [Paremcibacter congregatus]PHZ86208.1 protein translocase subunit SecF [Paremcibacter congregatus]QDE27174.1 protein translocase subunit SecF [Paremcibacter congregatus]
MLLKLVPENTFIKFINFRKFAYVFSLMMIVAAFGLYFSKGLNFGIDFEGGIMVEIGTEEVADIGKIRSTLSELDLGDVKVQEFGDPKDVLIRLEYQEGMTVDQVVEKVREVLPDAIEGEISYRRTETVGSTVSEELISDGIMAVILAIGAVLIYIWLRFEWQFGMGAVIALVHDVILTIGMFSLTGLEFNLSTIAAILTIVGYSLNDTVVVYDRIRENLKKFRKKPMPELLNLSINDTLSRTVMTSLTTLIALASLFFLGGEGIHGFSAAMIWGIFVGTYSSIFIAAPILLWVELRRDEPDTSPEAGVDVIPPQKGS